MTQILHIIYQDEINELKTTNDKLEKIPYFESYIKFPKNYKKDELVINCNTIKEKKIFLEIIKHCLYNDVFNPVQSLFIDYLKCFRFLCFNNVLCYFPESYYNTLDWTKYYEYLENLDNQYDRIYLTIQVEYAIEITFEEYQQIKKLLKIKNNDIYYPNFMTELAIFLLCTGLRTKTYYGLINIIIKAGYGISLPYDSFIFSEKPAPYNTTSEIISQTALSLFNDKSLSYELIETILDIDNYNNNLSYYILISKCIASNEIDKAVQLFDKVITCDIDLFVDLFSICNEQQRIFMLKSCRSVNKFNRTFSRIYLNKYILNKDKKIDDEIIINKKLFLEKINFPDITYYYDEIKKDFISVKR